MPKVGLTAIVAVVDRSGSMAAIRDDAIEGFNRFVHGQRVAPGEATLSLILFDHEYQEPYRTEKILAVPFLDQSTYAPRGQTALYDAIGRAITTLDEDIEKLPDAEQPEKVVVVILTDGQENASREYKRDQVQAMIDQRREVRGWQFVFLAADQNALQDARQNLGFVAAQSAGYSGTGMGTRAAFAAASDSIVAYRAGGDSVTVGDGSGDPIGDGTSDPALAQGVEVPGIPRETRFGNLGGKADDEVIADEENVDSGP